MSGMSPGINRETFKELLEMVSKDVIMLTHRGYYRQVDGVAIGSSVGPLLANIFVSRYDSELASFSKFYFRYVDDVIRTLRLPVTWLNTIWLNFFGWAEIGRGNGIENQS